MAKSLFGLLPAGASLEQVPRSALGNTPPKINIHSSNPHEYRCCIFILVVMKKHNMPLFYADLEYICKILGALSEQAPRFD